MGVLQDELSRVIQEFCQSDAVKSQLFEIILTKHGVSLSSSELLAFVKAIEKSDGADSIQIPTEGPHQNITIEQNDLEDAMVEFEKVVEGSAERVVNASLKEMPPRVLTSLYGALPEALKERRTLQRRFEKQLQKQWQEGLDRLEMLVIMAKESGASYLEDMQREFDEESSEEDSYLLDVLSALHARACRTAEEVLCLLKAGYADGADARWRSLHELAVTAQFMVEHRGDVPERFLDHAAIESWRAAQQYQKHCDALDCDSFSDEEMAEMRTESDAAVAKYGPSFNKDYGWAAQTLGIQRPKFADIEAKVDLSKWRPYFKRACQNIHAGSHGMFSSLAVPDHMVPMIVAGASNAGHSDPGHQTAISLMMASVALLTSFPNLDGLVTCKCMQLLCDDIGNAFLEAHEAMNSPVEGQP